MKKDKDELNEERLGKLIEMARRGEGNEKKIAIALAKKLCKKHGLDFDEMMASEKEIEYRIPYKNDDEKRVIVQIVLRYAATNMKYNVYENRFSKHIVFTTTQGKYIETLNAVEVLIRAYRREKEKIKEAVFIGFLDAHGLYYQPTTKERASYTRQAERERKKETAREKKIREMAERISYGMDDVEVHKAIPERTT